MIRKSLIAFFVVFALALSGLVLANPATATDFEPCVPADAWTETIYHPESGYQVYHDEINHVERRYAKFTHTKYRHGSGDWSAYSPWTIWGDGTAMSVWKTYIDGDYEVLGEPEFHGQGSDHGVQWYREYQVRWTGESRVVVDREAYYADVVITEAWTEVIEHPAVVCETPTEDPTPTPTETPTVTPTEDPTPVVPTVTPTETPTPVGTTEGEATFTPLPTPEVEVTEDIEQGTTETVRCVGNALVTVTTGPEGKSTSAENGAEECSVVTDQDTPADTTPGQPTEVVVEEGL